MNDDDLRRALALIDERRFAEAIDLAADAATFSPIDYPVLPTEFDDAPSSVARALALQWCLQDQQVVDLLEPVVEATPDQALAWRKKSFGNALDFVWALDSGEHPTPNPVPTPTPNPTPNPNPNPDPTPTPAPTPAPAAYPRYIFPGVGLGASVCAAESVPDSML